MPKLILKSGSAVLKEFELDTAKTDFTLGADKENDFIISNQKISTRHFRIEKVNHNYYIEDLQSTHGTVLNGRPLLNREQIVHGDEIAIGQLNLYFENITNTLQIEPFEDEDIEVIDDDFFEKNLNLDRSSETAENNVHESVKAETEHSSGTPTATEYYQIKEPATETTTLPVATETLVDEQKQNGASFYLMAIYGPYMGKKYPLKFGDTKIGRDETLNDIVIRLNEHGTLDPSISRRHATVSFNHGRFFITDKRSKTRTYVNQIKLDATDEVPVDEGDEIEIVSDQKSTILRLVSEDNLDSSPPKKAGVWWIRNRFRMATILAIFFGIIAFGAFGISCAKRMALNQKPNKLKFIEERWFSSNSADRENDHPQTAATRQAKIAVSDLNGDQKVDVVFADAAGRLQALDGVTKKSLWLMENFQVHPNIPIVLADFNANGLADVLAVGVDSRMRSLDGKSGAEIWLSPLLGESITGAPLVDDFDGDGLNDVLICTHAGQIHIGHGFINQIRWQTIHSGYALKAAPSSVDLNDDGMADIFIGTQDGHILQVQGRSGKIIHTVDLNEEISKITGEPESGHGIAHPIAIMDINHNQVKDLVIPSTRGRYLILESQSQRKIWYESLQAGQTAPAANLAAAFGKCDEDDREDAVLISPQKIKVLKGFSDSKNEKKVLWEFALQDDRFITPITLADFNKDQACDIVVGGGNGAVYVLSGINGELLANISNEGNPVVSPILAADLGSDGSLDMLLIRQDYSIYKIQTNSKIKKNGVVWSQSFANARHTGQYGYVQSRAKGYDIVTSTTGLLFLGLVVVNLVARKKRQKIMQKNQQR
ncbi:MAG: FHA domain-containing protein [bacterium]